MSEPYVPHIPTAEEYEQHRKNRQLIEELARLLKVQGKGVELAEKVRQKAQKLIDETEELKERLQSINGDALGS